MKTAQINGLALEYESAGSRPSRRGSSQAQ